MQTSLSTKIPETLSAIRFPGVMCFGAIAIATVLSIGNAHAQSGMPAWSRNVPAKGIVLPLCPDDYCGAVDENASIIIPFSRKNAFMGGDYKSTIIFSEKKKLGLRDVAGKVVVKPIYSEMYYDIAEYYQVSNGKNKNGLINNKGDVIIPLQFEQINVHELSNAIEARKGGKAYLYDLQGKPYKDVVNTLEFGFTFLDRDNDVRYGMNEWVGVNMQEPGEVNYYFNTRTNQRTKKYLRLASRSNEGFLIVSNAKEESTLLNTRGEEVFPFVKTYFNGPRSGLLVFSNEKREQGLMDTSGKIVMEPRFSYIVGLGKKGVLAMPKLDYQHVGVADLKGDWIIQPTLFSRQEGFDFTNNLVSISRDGKNYGIYDLDKLDWVLPEKFNHTSATNRWIMAGDLPPGLEAKTNEKPDPKVVKSTALYFLDGKPLPVKKYRMFNEQGVSDFGIEGYTYAWNESGGKRALIDPNGKELVGLEWDSYVYLNNMMFAGITSNNGSDFWQAYYAHDGKLIARFSECKDGKWHILNREGKSVWPETPCVK